jgi:hypothetical protein
VVWEQEQRGFGIGGKEGQQALEMVAGVRRVRQHLARAAACVRAR